MCFKCRVGVAKNRRLPVVSLANWFSCFVSGWLSGRNLFTVLRALAEMHSWDKASCGRISVSVLFSPRLTNDLLNWWCKNIVCIDVKGVRKGAHISFETTHTLHIWCFLLIRSRKRPYACLRQNFTIKLRFFKIIFPSVRAFTSLTWEFFWFTLLWEFTGVRNSVQDYALKVTLGDLFIASLKTFRAYFVCHNSLYIFATPRAEALSHEISQSSWFF